MASALERSKSPSGAHALLTTPNKNDCKRIPSDVFLRKCSISSHRHLQQGSTLDREWFRITIHPEYISKEILLPTFLAIVLKLLRRSEISTHFCNYLPQTKHFFQRAEAIMWHESSGRTFKLPYSYATYHDTELHCRVNSEAITWSQDVPGQYLQQCVIHWGGRSNLGMLCLKLREPQWEVYVIQLGCRHATSIMPDRKLILGHSDCFFKWRLLLSPAILP